MEHDQRVCPRCGEPAGESRFCESCRSQIAGTHPAEARYPATQALRDVLRLEEALAAASKGISERIAARSPGAATEVDHERPPAPDADAAAGTLGIAKLPSTDRALDSGGPARTVARLEDVLTVAPSKPATAPVAAEPVVPAKPVLETLPAKPVLETPPPAPVPLVQPPAPAPIEAPEPPPIAAEAPSPAVEEEPSFLTAPAERTGFWFDYMPMRVSREAAEEIAEQAPQATEVPEAAVPEIGPEEEAVEAAGTNHWLAALCLIALIGVLVLLTGRDPRRSARA